MSGEVKLGETQYSGKHCYLCQIPYVKYPGKGLLMPTAFSKLFVLENAKNIRHNFFVCLNMIKPGTYVN